MLQVIECSIVPNCDILKTPYVLMHDSIAQSLTCKQWDPSQLWKECTGKVISRLHYHIKKRLKMSYRTKRKHHVPANGDQQIGMIN